MNIFHLSDSLHSMLNLLLGQANLQVFLGEENAWRWEMVSYLHFSQPQMSSGALLLSPIWGKRTTATWFWMRIKKTQHAAKIPAWQMEVYDTEQLDVLLKVSLEICCKAKDWIKMSNSCNTPLPSLEDSLKINALQISLDGIAMENCLPCQILSLSPFFRWSPWLLLP